MSKKTVLQVQKVIGSPLANERRKGERLREKIIEFLEEHGSPVVLDFSEVGVVTSSFLDAALGKIPKRWRNPRYVSFRNLPETILSEAERYLQPVQERWMITRVRVKGYRSLKDFEWKGIQALNVLFGPNASGKSSILEALQLLQRAHLQSLPQFLEELTERYGTQPRALISKRKRSTEIELELHNGQERRSYRLRFWLNEGRWEAFGEMQGDQKKQIYTFIQTEDGPFSSQGTYEEEFLAPLRKMHWIRLRVRDLKAPSREGERVLRESGRGLPTFIHSLQKNYPERFRSLLYALKRYVPEIKNIGVERLEIFGEPHFQLWVQDPMGKHPAPVVSEGTLRILALLAFFHDPEGPLILGIDEPENGIHPGRLRFWARFAEEQAKKGKAQVFLATHSPVLGEVVDQQYWWWCRRDPETGTWIQRFSPDIRHPAEVLG